MDEKETTWWNYWNVQHRTAAKPVDSVYEELGRLVLREAASLALERPNVIEVGCGTGWLSPHLKALGTYRGIDLSPAAIEVAKQRCPGGDFSVADIHMLDVPAPGFDLAISVDTVAYFRDQRQAFASLAAILRPGGYLVLTTVNPFVYRRIRRIGPPAPGQVRHWLTKGQLYDLLLQGGFKPLKYFTALPAGDRGVLRVLNTPKLNRPLEMVVPATWIQSAKERLGLGQFQIVTARRG